MTNTGSSSWIIQNALNSSNCLNKRPQRRCTLQCSTNTALLLSNDTSRTVLWTESWVGCEASRWTREMRMKTITLCIHFVQYLIWNSNVHCAMQLPLMTVKVHLSRYSSEFVWESHFSLHHCYIWISPNDQLKTWLLLYA